MKMTRMSFVVMGVCAVIMLLGLPAQAVIQYSGLLTSDNGGIAGTGVWVDPGITALGWTVTQNNPGEAWHYAYALSVPGGDISHFILELSPDANLTDILDVTGSSTNLSVDTFSAADQGNSNPNMPSPIYGVKFDEVDTTLGIFHFDSFKAPVWGDFYAKNGTAGNDQGVYNTAWNAGLGTADPISEPTDGSLDNKILRPDTSTEPIPDASSLVLICIGALPLAISRLKKK